MIEHIRDWFSQFSLQEILGGLHIPFTLMTQTGVSKVNWTRIVEMLLIAAIVGTVSYLGTIKAMEARMESMKENQDKIGKNIKDISQKLDYHILWHLNKHRK